MKSSTRALLIGAMLALSLIRSAAAAEWTLSGRVVAPQGRRHLRNARRQDAAPHPHRGIDAPERRQPYGNASKDSLSRLVFNRNVEARCYKRDRYGRNVCRVFTREGGKDVGLEMVRAGLAWWFREYAKEQTPEEQGAYQGAEDAARMTKRGLWKEPKPVPPWEWRRQQALESHARRGSR